MVARQRYDGFMDTTFNSTKISKLENGKGEVKKQITSYLRKAQAF